MAKTYRVGIIGRTGKGSYGHGVDVAISKVPNVDVVALADEDEAGRAAAQKRTKAKTTYADYRQMFDKEKLDLVAICPRWIDQHHEMIVAAAEHSCHVYMEKPFCRTLAECDDAMRQLEMRHLKLAIAHISQWSPVLDVAKSLVHSGEIGEVLELRGRGKEDASRGGGEDLWVLGSHIFGLMRAFAGNATNCYATVMSKQHKVTKADVVDGAEGIGPLAGDAIDAMYAFGNGINGYFSSHRNAAGTPTRFALQVFGTKGILETESGYGAKTHLLKDSSWSPGRTGQKWVSVTSAGVGKPEPRQDLTYEEGHIAAIKDLIDCIERDRQPRCSAEDSRAIVEMIAAIYESHRVGGPVPLPLKTRVNPLTLLP